MGTGASTPTANKVLVGDGVGTSSWSAINLTTMTDGTLPVNKGGTGTTTSTGSGSVVLDTSPTLTTPTIADFSNAGHDHSNSAGGEPIGTAGIIDYNVTKVKLEIPHFNSLFFSTDNGTVFSNSQVQILFSAESSHAVGITSSGLGTASPKMTIARNGTYTLNYRMTCIDVAASSFIFWFAVAFDGSTNVLFRQQDVAIGVGNSASGSITIWLPVGATVCAQWYNGGGNTRFGYENTANTSAESLRDLRTGLSVTEIR